MGQQQLLLVILVTIIVGIATVVAINIFGDAAEQANKDAVRQDLLAASAQAQGVYTRPVMMGGGGGSFGGTDGDGNAVGNLDDEQLAAQIGIPGVREGAQITNENAVYTVAGSGESMTVEAEPTGSTGTWTLTVTRNDGDGETAFTVQILDGDGNTVSIGSTD